MKMNERCFIDKRKKIIRLLNYVNVTIPFYRNIGLHINNEESFHYSDFQILPIIKKEFYKTHYRKLINPAFDLQKDLGDTVFVRHTSGSTGSPLTLYCSTEEKILENIELMKERSRFMDINTVSMKWIAIYPTINNLYDIIDNAYETEVIIPNRIYKDNLGVRYLVDGTEHSNRELLNFLHEYQPTLVISITHVLFNLAQYLNHNPPEDFTYIQHLECISEYLTQQEKQCIHRAFGLIPRNMYAANELRIIGYECKYNCMHLNKNSVFVEIMDCDENGYGDIVITNLLKRDFPFIRYNLGDKGKLTYRECPCGSNEPVLELTQFRSNDSIVCEDGRHVHFFIVSDIINHLCKKYDVLLERYQFVQNDFGCFDFNIERMPVEKRVLFETQFTHSIQKALHIEPIQIHYQYQELLTKDARYCKFKYFVNNIKGK